MEQGKQTCKILKDIRRQLHRIREAESTADTSESEDI